VSFPIDSNFMVSLGMQKIEVKLRLPHRSEVGVMLPDWVTAKGEPLAVYI